MANNERGMLWKKAWYGYFQNIDRKGEVLYEQDYSRYTRRRKGEREYCPAC